MRTLILTPTELEAKAISIEDSSVTVAVCGFGPLGASVGTSQLLRKHSPDRVVLAGIAGSLADDVAIGKAYSFSTVVMHGIGVIKDQQLVPPRDLGFAEVNWDPPPLHSGEFELQVSDSVETLPQLLTVCQSLESISDAKQRATFFPQARAEDMEGYAVAMACFAQGIPLTIIRGISNIAGDRDKSNWNIDAALNSAVNAVKSTLSS